ncbi:MULTISPECIES: hypothetical protein [unclassified Acinetobacter]|uniref:hypothetical protein n=1 Tax=unclassified Acinetobacter TaxID=196816 RepID=UPI002934233B|nr:MULTISPECIES: hypothetical protein [unclassified Acinetobacter]WOE31977.1 hypothetical protein QSG84_01755 [Acinetobacter sp. SAAs470]WOE37445.1 hypothetical protein QSG86_10800 [Acinetobacter sp. SAAs474]
MSFKYQAPEAYKSKKIITAGQTYEVKNGVVESEEDIYNILAPMGFIRIVVEAKANTTKGTAIVKS